MPPIRFHVRAGTGPNAPTWTVAIARRDVARHLDARAFRSAFAARVRAWPRSAGGPVFVALFAAGAVAAFLGWQTAMEPIVAGAAVGVATVLRWARRDLAGAWTETVGVRVAARAREEVARRESSRLSGAFVYGHNLRKHCVANGLTAIHEGRVVRYRSDGKEHEPVELPEELEAFRREVYAPREFTLGAPPRAGRGRPAGA